MDPKKIKLEEGKVVITDESVITQIKEQGLEFNSDGSLNIQEGTNLQLTVTWG